MHVNVQAILSFGSFHAPFMIDNKNSHRMHEFLLFILQAKNCHAQKKEVIDLNFIHTLLRVTIALFNRLTFHCF